MVKASVRDVDRGWASILKAASEVARGATVKVGILGATDRGGLHLTDPETGKSADLTVAEIAVVQEFGTVDGSIPARPAHRMTFDQRQGAIQEQAFKLIVAVVIDRRLTVSQALNIMGVSHATAIKNFITQQSGELLPNAPSTARMKARGVGIKRQRAIAGARPLIDTGRTLNAISWAVDIAGKEAPATYLSKGAA